jgi:hypothetical protein
MMPDTPSICQNIFHSPRCAEFFARSRDITRTITRFRCIRLRKLELKALIVTQSLPRFSYARCSATFCELTFS